MVMAPPATHDLAVSPCFHICLAFQHRLFPLQSPPALLLNLSLHSTAALALGLLQLAAAVLSRDLCPSLGCVWLRQGLILIPSRLPQISCFTLSLKCLSSDSDLDVGMDPCFSFPTWGGQVQSY